MIEGPNYCSVSLSAHCQPPVAKYVTVLTEKHHSGKGTVAEAALDMVNFREGHVQERKGEHGEVGSLKTVEKVRGGRQDQDQMFVGAGGSELGTPFHTSLTHAKP